MANLKYLAIPCCLILAALFLSVEKKEKYVAAVVSKGLASLCFVVLGLLNAGGSSLSRLVVIGLALGLIADVMLNLRYVFKKKGQLIFLIGIVIFLSGHVVYLAAVLPLCLFAGCAAGLVLPGARHQESGQSEKSLLCGLTPEL